MACCIFNIKSPDDCVESGGLASFPYFSGGRNLRKLEGAGMELSSVQLVRKFAATLSNTMIRQKSSIMIQGVLANLGP